MEESVQDFAELSDYDYEQVAAELLGVDFQVGAP